MRVITMGMHVLDVLVRPVEAIPEGQGTTLVEDIRVTAAGTAGGTALTLAKLGASVRSAGAIGADATGDLLVQLLGRPVSTPPRSSGAPARPPRRACCRSAPTATGRPCTCSAPT
jgi:sugar/nucleoside kinase (ribokinase family)